MPAWGAVGGILGGGAAIGGSLIAASKSAKEARKNRRFQERMSNTAYQRARADMKSAGLNPLLMASVGPASTPGGATAQVPDFGSSLAKGVSTGVQAMQAQSQIRNIDAQTAKTVKETEQLGRNRPGAIIGDALGDMMTKGASSAKGAWKDFKKWQKGAGHAGSYLRESQHEPKSQRNYENTPAFKKRWN